LRSILHCAEYSTTCRRPIRRLTTKLGVRVRVPFGRRQLIGVLVGIAQASSISAAKLKPRWRCSMMNRCSIP